MRQLTSKDAVHDMRMWTIIAVLTAAMPLTITTDSIQTLHQDRVTLKCLNTVMLLEMDLQDIPTIKTSSLHLRHFSCRPHRVTDTSAFFRVPLQGCGTTSAITRGSGNGYIAYSNVVKNSSAKNISRVMVTHAPKLQYHFICYYRQKYLITLQSDDENPTRNGTGEKQRPKGPEMTRPVSTVLSSSGQAIFPTITSIALAEFLIFFAIFIQ